MSFLLLIILGTLALNTQCFYVDTDTTNKTDIDPSDVLTKTFATSTVPSKDNSTDISCKYSIREFSFVGPVISQVEVGTPLFHRWECDADENYGILVKNCYASDEQSRKVRFIDEEGCIDLDFGESQLIYSSTSNMAYVVMDTFMFADSSIVHISCQIDFCDKRLDECRGVTPPICKSKSPRMSLLGQITNFLKSVVSTLREYILQKPEQILVLFVCISLIVILFLVHLMIYLAIKYNLTKWMVKKPAKYIKKNIIDV